MGACPRGGTVGTAGDPGGLCPACLTAVALVTDPGERVDDGNGRRPGGRGRRFLGPYRLLHRLGEGGMGTVYLAEQQAPIRRTAAFKAAYQEFLTLWKDADPDVPVLQQAKAEFAKLP